MKLYGKKITSLLIQCTKKLVKKFCDKLYPHFPCNCFIKIFLGYLKGETTHPSQPKKILVEIWCQKVRLTDLTSLKLILGLDGCYLQNIWSERKKNLMCFDFLSHWSKAESYMLLKGLNFVTNICFTVCVIKPSCFFFQYFPDSCSWYSRGSDPRTAALGQLGNWRFPRNSPWL